MGSGLRDGLVGVRFDSVQPTNTTAARHATTPAAGFSLNLSSL
jgi:hypothetical protein